MRPLLGVALILALAAAWRRWQVRAVISPYYDKVRQARTWGLTLAVALVERKPSSALTRGTASGKATVTSAAGPNGRTRS